ncbi:hypothetical protein YC2023_039138 [Brassica napus]
MDYVRGRGSRDVWTIDAALVGGGLETSGLATQIVWGVGAETFAFDAALEGGELNFHSGSSIYSSQWFACLASHTSRSNSTITHPLISFPFQVKLSIGDNLSCGELLKDEVLGSSNAKRINNLPVDVEAVPPTVRGPHPLTTLLQDELSTHQQPNYEVRENS